MTEKLYIYVFLIYPHSQLIPHPGEKVPNFHYSDSKKKLFKIRIEPLLVLNYDHESSSENLELTRYYSLYNTL